MSPVPGTEKEQMEKDDKIIVMVCQEVVVKVWITI